jgi:3-hydroxyisobutyrate dehydrogenase
MTQRIGFVGIGQIGRPLVESMLRGGLVPTVFDIDPLAVRQVAELGAKGAGSLADVARASDVVGVCVPADAHVRSVLDGPDGLFAHLSPGAVVAVHSTVLPETIEWASARAEASGVKIVEACLTGGPTAAAEGRTTFLLGGDPDDLAAIDPILDACGETLVNAGSLGNANLLKLCLNLQTYVTHLGIAEAIRLAKAFNLPVEGLKQAMRANEQLGQMGEAFFGLHELPRTVLEDANVVTMRRRSGAIVEKDLELMRLIAESHGVDVPARNVAASEFSRTYLLGRNQRNEET